MTRTATQRRQWMSRKLEPGEAVLAMPSVVSGARHALIVRLRNGGSSKATDIRALQ